MAAETLRSLGAGDHSVRPANARPASADSRRGNCHSGGGARPGDASVCVCVCGDRYRRRRRRRRRMPTTTDCRRLSALRRRRPNGRVQARGGRHRAPQTGTRGAGGRRWTGAGRGRTEGLMALTINDSASAMSGGGAAGCWGLLWLASGARRLCCPLASVPSRLVSRLWLAGGAAGARRTSLREPPTPRARTPQATSHQETNAPSGRRRSCR